MEGTTGRKEQGPTAQAEWGQNFGIIETFGEGNIAALLIRLGRYTIRVHLKDREFQGLRRVGGLQRGCIRQGPLNQIVRFAFALGFLSSIRAKEILGTVVLCIKFTGR